MRRFILMIGRNMKLFFKDKGMMIATFLTPVILLLLYLTFLRNITYTQITNSILDGIKKTGFTNFTLYKIVPKSKISGLTNAQLLSSLLAVSAITVSFATNLIMVHDKSSKTIKDLLVSPVPSWQLALAYFVSAVLTALLILLPISALACILIVTTGGILSVGHAMALMGTVILLVLVGTAGSSFIYFFLKTELQMTAVSTFISAGYGFICGGYMPLAVVGKLKGFMSILPTTFMTSLVRKFSMQESIDQIKSTIASADQLIDKINPDNAREVSGQIARGLAEGLDVNIIVGNTNVKIWVMFLITMLLLVVLLTMFIMANVISQKLQVRRKLIIRKQ